MQTYKELINKRNKLQNDLAAIHRTISDSNAFIFVDNVHRKISQNIFMSSDKFADLLVEELHERDYPICRGEINEIFKFSEFAYNESHIDAKKPDSQECIKEEIRYYKS
jgi:hypothetical protein